MTKECTDEFHYLKHLSDDSLYNELQSTKLNLFWAEHDVESSNKELIEKYENKIEFIHEVLDERGLNAHKQF